MRLPAASGLWIIAACLAAGGCGDSATQANGTSQQTTVPTVPASASTRPTAAITASPSPTAATAASSSPTSTPTASPSPAAATTASPVRRPGCSVSLRYRDSTTVTQAVLAYFVVRNQGDRRCKIAKFPSVTLSGPDGRLDLKQGKANPHLPHPRHPVRVLPAGGKGHFYLIFSSNSYRGGRCAPAAERIRVRFSRGVTARAQLPQRVVKFHAPINPCPHTGFSATRVGVGIG